MFIRGFHRKILKCIEDVETENLQHAQNPDDDQLSEVSDYNPSD